MTMGALHDGHRELIKVARRRCEVIVVTVFLNPLQFAPSEDLSRYPKTLESDVALCAEENVDLVFAPDGRGGLPGGASRRCGCTPGRSATSSRARRGPGHFDGVLTVVAKLLHLTVAGRRVLRPEGRPAAAAHLADGRRPRTSRSRWSRCRPCATPTGWRCPAATCTSTDDDRGGGARAVPGAAPPGSAHEADGADAVRRAAARRARRRARRTARLPRPRRARHPAPRSRTAPPARRCSPSRRGSAPPG